MLTISEDRCTEVFEKACNLYAASPDWATFFRQVMGVGGVIRTAFPISQDLEAFEKSSQYQETQEMLAKLREKTSVEIPDQEPTKVITVRLPKCLHESLRSEAYERKTSMNKLCISKLLQIIDGKLVPTDTATNGKASSNGKAAANGKAAQV